MSMLTREDLEAICSRFVLSHDCEVECKADLQDIVAHDALQRQRIAELEAEVARLKQTTGA